MFNVIVSDAKGWHSFPFQANNNLEVFEYFTEKGYRVIAIYPN